MSVRCFGTAWNPQGVAPDGLVVHQQDVPSVPNGLWAVRAIGDSARLRAALDEEERVQVYQQYAQTYGLGDDLQVPRTVSVPAYAGNLRLVSAQEVPR